MEITKQEAELFRNLLWLKYREVREYLSEEEKNNTLRLILRLRRGSLDKD